VAPCIVVRVTAVVELCEIAFRIGMLVKQVT
jgi:hypothetical protein